MIYLMNWGFGREAQDPCNPVLGMENPDACPPLVATPCPVRERENQKGKKKPPSFDLVDALAGRSHFTPPPFQNSMLPSVSPPTVLPTPTSTQKFLRRIHLTPHEATPPSNNSAGTPWTVAAG